jgi:hypothetical protein
MNFAIPTGSPLLTTAMGLVTLSLQDTHPSATFHPNDFLLVLSLGTTFHSPVPNRDVVVTQLLHTPTIMSACYASQPWLVHVRRCRRLLGSTPSAAQIFNPLKAAFSGVERLTLEYGSYILSSVRHNEADQGTLSFSNVTRWRISPGVVARARGTRILWERRRRHELATVIDARRIAGRAPCFPGPSLKNAMFE